MEQFSIRTLLEQKRVVPEIQREYVWGEKSYIVEQFINTLNFSTSSFANVGFLYSYESNDEFHLIDGQQRFTTIILLALYCAKIKATVNVDNDSADLEYQKILSHFSYRVRSSTDIFLQSLISNNLNGFSEETIKAQRFYHENYKDDKSIQSIINCLEVINSFRNKKGDSFKITLEWLLDKVYFWKFDVIKTTQGEELYISMNSRGEELTAVEQIKPRLFEEAREQHLFSKSGISWGKLWDNWEDMFFEQCHDVVSVKNAMDRLVILALEFKTKIRHSEINPVENCKFISLLDIEKCAEAYDHLRLSFQSEMAYIFEKEFSEHHKQVILCAFSSVFHSSENEEIKQAIHFVNNWAMLGLIKPKCYSNYLEFLDRFVNSNKSFYNFCQDERDATIGVLNSEHELKKISLCGDTHLSKDVEPLIFEMDDFYSSGRDLRCIWHEAFDEEYIWDLETVEKFRDRAFIFKELFAENVIKKNTSIKTEVGTLDNRLLSRALLTIGNYHIWSSASNYAFGHYHEDKWPEIMRTHSNVISRLIDKVQLYNDVSSIYDRLNMIINDSINSHQFPKNDARYYILAYPDSLRALYEGYNILSMSNPNDWTNFGIWINSKMTCHSYYLQMFDAIVIREINSEQFNTNTLFHKRLQVEIKCSPNRGWDVLWPETSLITPEELKQNLIKKFGESRVIDNEVTRKLKRFYIPMLEEDDQIELGKEIAQYIIDFGNSI